MAWRRGRELAAVCAVGVGLAVVAAAPAVSGGRSPAAAEAVVRDVGGAGAGGTGPAAADAGGPAVVDAGELLALPVSPRTPSASAAVPARLPLPTAGPAVVGRVPSWGPPPEVLAAAADAAAGMSLDRLAGQVIVVQYGGTDPAQAAATLTNWHLGGVIVMSDNVADAAQVRASTAAFHAAVAADGRTWPAVVAVDEEGGRVSRLRAVLDELPAFATFAGDEPRTAAAFRALGAQLADLGFTMDLAPVADVTIGAADPTIGDRSASSDPAVAARTVRAAADALLAGGVVPVLKHFPGHGSVTVDSHARLPAQPATLDQLLARDLVPFAAGIRDGAPAVMLAHLDVAVLDPGVPATLSRAAYELLRDGLGFRGVTVTDALNMAAVPESTPGEASVRALAAGADLLLMPRDAGAAVTAIVAAVQDGRVPVERLREAATRVIALQMWTATLQP